MNTCIFLGKLKVQVFLGMPDRTGIFFFFEWSVNLSNFLGLGVEAGASPMYPQKNESTPAPPPRAANKATVSVRIRTIPLRLRYELGHAQLPPRFATVRHECFKQFKTSVALPWSFPNHHDSSRFTTIHHGSTTNHYGTRRFYKSWRIVAAP